MDDGILFACAPDWEGVETLLRAQYTVCEDWLRMSGLAIEPDKTKVMFFEKARECHATPLPRHLLLPDREGSTYYSVMPAETLRYLGFFFQKRQKWDHHTTIMANQARASIKALSVLGNTIRGLSMANWRLVMNAVCLPVLTYGCQLWYHEGGKGVKTHVNRLQMVQNEMVKVVAGSFRMAPREALLEITRMLPMRHFLLRHGRDVHPTWVKSSIETLSNTRVRGF